jgi:hypothetical protein
MLREVVKDFAVASKGQSAEFRVHASDGACALGDYPTAEP